MRSRFWHRAASVRSIASASVEQYRSPASVLGALGGMFDAVVLSQDHDVEKPDRRLYDVAAAEVRSGPDEVVMVRDSLPNDVRGDGQCIDNLWEEFSIVESMLEL